MAELTAEDVEAFTNGRLVNDGGGGEVTRMLNTALAVARRHVGWHVSPVREDDEIVLDGPGGRRLQLPTRNIGAIASIEEDGAVTDPALYVKSADVPGLVMRRSGRWTCELSGITVTLDHGYTEDEAADWRQAILTMVDQMSQVPTVQAGAGALIRKRVDDIEYQWSDSEISALAEGSLFSVESILDSYSRQPVYFA